MKRLIFCLLMIALSIYLYSVYNHQDPPPRLTPSGELMYNE